MPRTFRLGHIFSATRGAKYTSKSTQNKLKKCKITQKKEHTMFCMDWLDPGCMQPTKPGKKTVLEYPNNSKHQPENQNTLRIRRRCRQSPRSTRNYSKWVSVVTLSTNKFIVRVENLLVCISLFFFFLHVIYLIDYVLDVCKRGQ